ncbi:hypothetical protein BH11PSE4_BH11PSE4_09550 [soil metagenome]
MDNRDALSLSELHAQSVQIAWDYLRRTGELGNPQQAERFLNARIEHWIRQGNRSRLMLSNKAIIAYRDFTMPSPSRASGPTIIHSA